MGAVIRVENVSKLYKLGLIGGGTLSGDLNRWWARVRGKPDPLLKIGEKDHGNRSGEYIWALRDINFEVQPGEVLGIIGKNGAGKSTLLKIISRITAPTSGAIKIKGRIGALLEVGTGFHPELTGRENVFLNGAILGMTKSEVTRKFDEIVDFSGVEQFIDTPVKRYSSGMKVRLAFAVAAHLDPEILIIDEVLAVGDAEFQKKCLGKMGEVSKEGRTVLFVSHNMAAVESLCGRGELLENGTIAFAGSAASAIQKYLTNTKKEEGATSYKSDFLDLLDVKLFRDGIETDDTIFTYDSVKFLFSFVVKQPIRDFFFGMRILDEWQRLVFAFHSREAGLRIDQAVEKRLVVEYDIPNTPLLEGSYYIQIVIVASSGAKLLEIPIAKYIHVLSRDIANSGHPFIKGHGIVFIPFVLSLTANGNIWQKRVGVQ